MTMRIYYTVEQRRGVEYDGLGQGFDKYYMEQTIKIYPTAARNEEDLVRTVTKTFESSFPMRHDI